ncbi:efflux RND transporter periplasmic adaptor subunit [Fuerstiella marisgermanici]|uniref:Putative efflux pump membrane fusion protein n=1 Tax=Fuerstiella marisgermanici TaxID=1891926 RepID=A0A1P8WHS0_9PLAN|nr:HlyD family efflux transporter periplasmic adaptor subunit [Fuerstiella marisgermanici]APZ93583.1 putative efflux pump membrane fusion protein [Fuerstiella marisgermanici]
MNLYVVSGPIRQLLLAGSAIAVLAMAGCNGKGEAEPYVPGPRPVSVKALVKQSVPQAMLAAATVGSWKTEELGFEVGGRVEWVVEPNQEIEGRVEDADGNLIVEGTPVARLESERYRLQVETAKANIVQAEQAVKAATIELEKGLPAQIRAAQADASLALTQLNRSKQLFEKSAGTESDVDRDDARYQSAVATVEQMDADLKSKEAELQSLQSSLLQAKQSLRDAQRNLDDCTLYSSFRGEIAHVAVVPGSVVSAGQPVATIQMMDPIKVEVEVSAEDSRRLRSRERLAVMVSKADGTVEEHDGFLYLIDSVADAATRTYTVTVLVLNKKESAKSPAASSAPDAPAIATTTQTWRMNLRFIPGAKEGLLYVAEDAIHTQDGKSWLWKVENVETHQPLPADKLLKVSKLPVELGPAKIPFLGNWIFQQVLIDDESFDPDVNIVAGKLNVPTGEASDWDGDTIRIADDSQWELRPGELVKVDLSGSSLEQGYFVSMDAIVREGNRSFLFVVDGTDDAATVKRTEVRLATSDQPTATSSLRQVAPLEGESLDGLLYVTSGAHYLRDGEPVQVVMNGKAAQ